MTKECKQQFTLRITQANSTQLIVILYEMTLQYLADGEQAADDAGLVEAAGRRLGVAVVLGHEDAGQVHDRRHVHGFEYRAFVEIGRAHV